MTTEQAFPQRKIDSESFLSALKGGALDACLDFLRRGDGDGAQEAAWNCRLAEALMHAGRQAEAVACCRRAMPSVRGDAALLQICAWVFSNSALPADAAAAYRLLLDLAPDWTEGHRHLSGVLAAAGQPEAAAAAAETAAAAAPDNAEFAAHAGALLLAVQRYEAAARHLARAAALAPGNAHRAVEAAEALLRCDRPGQAADLLARAAAICAGPDIPRLLRVLSAAEMLRGRLEAALTAIDRALAAAPETAEYHLHRAHLLWQQGDVAGAALALDRAAALDPDGAEVKRAQLSLFLANGLVSEATEAGGELLRRFPDDRATAEAVLHLLNHRLDTIDGDYVVVNDNAPRALREPRAPPGMLTRMRHQQRVIRALILRETRTRFAEFRIGYGWALIEPILHISLLSVTFAVLMHGRPPIGKHFFIFYYTGLIPFHVFVHSSAGMSYAIIGNGPLLQLPPVTTFDVIAARGLLEIMTDMIVAVILLLVFTAIGVAHLPDDLWTSTLALLVTAVFGLGIGFFNAVLTLFWPSWEKAYNQLARILYFISGIFYVPGMMPDWVRNMLAWNPLMDSVDWFRVGFFASYRPHWLDRPYFIALAILSLLGGLLLHRLVQRRLRVPL